MEGDEHKTSIGQKMLKGTLEEEGLNSHVDPCVICLDAVSERAFASPCHHHSFDFLCLVSWLQERPVCPLCLWTPAEPFVGNGLADRSTGNIEVREVEYDKTSPNDFKVYKITSNTREISSNDAHSRPSHFIHGRDQRRLSGWRPRRAQIQHLVNLDAALLRRKEIYRLRLYSLHVGTNRMSRFRDLRPQLFVQDQELVSRAKKWIRRELQVFQFLNLHGVGEGRGGDNAEFLLEYIVAILKTVDVKGNQAEG